MKPVFTAHQVREFESSLVRSGTSMEELMDRAGAAVARYVEPLAGTAPVLVLVGPGNNGGDGLIAAERLRRAGSDVVVYAFARTNVGAFAGTVHHAEDDHDLTTILDLIRSARTVVDAVLGIGQSRPLDGRLARVVECVNKDSSPSTRIVSVDIPTGISADTGVVLGSAMRATETLCMMVLKPGLVQYPGADYAGDVHLLGLDVAPDPTAYGSVFLSDDQSIRRLLPTRAADGNKGKSGRVLLVGGSREYSGAPAMSAMAAYRSGAGLVQIGVPASVLPSVSARVFEPIFLSLPEEDGKLSLEALEPVDAALQSARAAVIGPGMGLSEATRVLTLGILDSLARSRCAAVIDADALNSLAQSPQWWSQQASLVLTPHPGEMARLTGRSIEDVQANRIGIAREFAEKWQVVVVLKGARTIVASPRGDVRINPTGGPNLATAGSGDILSGIIVGLLAQGCDPFSAAVAGCYLHGRAGDRLHTLHGVAGTIASDLLGTIPVARLSILHDQENTE